MNAPQPRTAELSLGTDPVYDPGRGVSVNPYYGPPGYTCSACGCFVPYGTTHSCTGYRATPPSTTNWDRMSDVRIADALERIADALEKLVTREEARDA